MRIKSSVIVSVTLVSAGKKSVTELTKNNILFDIVLLYGLYKLVLLLQELSHQRN